MMRSFTSSFTSVLVPTLLLALAPGCASELEDDEALAASELAIGDLPTVELVPTPVDNGAAVALIVRNASTRGVYCKSLAFRAPIARLDHCGEPPLTSELVELKNVSLAAGQVNVHADPAAANTSGALGRELMARFVEDRRRLGFSGETYEFCPMGASDRVTDCGYTCVQNDVAHVYGEEWKVVNPGDDGYKRYRCEATGTITTIETVCRGGLAVGASRRQTFTGYFVIETCQPDGTIFTTVECMNGYQKTADGNSCVPASCGSTPHGAEYLLNHIDNGRVVTTCEFGQPAAGQRVICNTDFVEQNRACVPRPMRSCAGGLGHGQSRTYRDCFGGRDAMVTETCNDGRITKRTQSTNRRCQ